MALDFLDGIRRRASNVDLPDHRGMSLPEIDLSDLPRPDLSAAGRAVSEGVGALGKRIDDIATDLRQVRVVKGPEPRVAPAAGIALLGGIGAGMGLMYFFDPRVGEQRRERLMSRIQGLIGQATQAVNERRGQGGSEWDDLGGSETTESLGSGNSLTSDPLTADSFGDTDTVPTLESPELAESRI